MIFSIISDPIARLRNWTWISGHLLDHMDDGIVINGTWQNVYGGWFSAGDYAKHIYWGTISKV